MEQRHRRRLHQSAAHDRHAADSRVDDGRGRAHGRSGHARQDWRARRRSIDSHDDDRRARRDHSRQCVRLDGRRSHRGCQGNGDGRDPIGTSGDACGYDAGRDAPELHTAKHLQRSDGRTADIDHRRRCLRNPAGYRRSPLDARRRCSRRGIPIVRRNGAGRRAQARPNGDRFDALRCLCVDAQGLRDLERGGHSELAELRRGFLSRDCDHVRRARADHRRLGHESCDLLQENLAGAGLRVHLTELGRNDTAQRRNADERARRCRSYCEPVSVVRRHDRAKRLRRHLSGDAGRHDRTVDGRQPHGPDIRRHADRHRCDQLVRRCRYRRRRNAGGFDRATCAGVSGRARRAIDLDRATHRHGTHGAQRQWLDDGRYRYEPRAGDARGPSAG